MKNSIIENAKINFTLTLVGTESEVDSTKFEKELPVGSVISKMSFPLQSTICLSIELTHEDVLTHNFVNLIRNSCSVLEVECRVWYTNGDFTNCLLISNSKGAVSVTTNFKNEFLNHEIAETCVIF